MSCFTVFSAYPIGYWWGEEYVSVFTYCRLPVAPANGKLLSPVKQLRLLAWLLQYSVLASDGLSIAR